MVILEQGTLFFDAFMSNYLNYKKQSKHSFKSIFKLNTAALAQWFTDNFSFTTEQVKQWFTYNPNHPLLFNSSLFLGLFLVFYLVYIFTKKHVHFRTVYVTLFSLFFLLQSRW